MSNIEEFINTLFEKSKILNDMNTEFLGEIEFGKLTQAQRIDLFYRNTKYHENVLNVIESIVKDLDKTSVLLSSEQKLLAGIYNKLDDFSKNKIIGIFEALQDTIFIPKNLTTCPYCGSKLIPDTLTNKSCKKVPLIINDKILGYTVNCLEMRKHEFK